MLCGLLGRKLSHSYSPQIHGYLGEYDYSLFEVEPQSLNEFFKHADFTGINVTIPYKKEVVSYCAELSDCAKKLGAVNTVVRRSDGSLIGHNTDYFGFLSMLKRSGLHVENNKALVLGSGGASATVSTVLREQGARVVVISRSGEDNYTNLEKHKDASIIVNTTPLGMYPNIDISPVDLAQFPKLQGVLDLIYNPAHTQLLQQAEKLGLITQNGLWMLVAQAKESAQWFTGKEISDSIIADIYKKLQQQMENLILIGMPGSGKSTIGRHLAERLGMEYIDIDAEVVKTAGISIPDIFAKSGETGFRKLETETIEKLGMLSGKVIATGGGCVTRQENYQYLHQNGKIIWLQRDIAKLPTDGRPLSQIASLETMYAVREPLYKAFADYQIDNNNSAENTIDNIISALNWED